MQSWVMRRLAVSSIAWLDGGRDNTTGVDGIVFMNERRAHKRAKERPDNLTA